MTWIIVTVLLSVVFWGGVAVLLYARNMRQRANVELAGGRGATAEDLTERARVVSRIGYGVMGGAAVLWLLITAFMSVHTVGQREVAIVYNFSGTISGKRDPGVVTIAPWQHIKKENVGIQHGDWNFGLDNSAVSADQQKIFALLAINYQIDPVNVVDLYKRVGPSWKTIIIDSRVPQVFKEITATFTTPKITEKRERLRLETKRRLATELALYDIKVVDVFVKNLGFSDTYSDAIEEKQKQVQDAARAQAKVAQVEAEARQKIALAEGDAKANIARARGEATANRLRQQSLTPLLVQQQAIEKLNDKVTVIICPPNTVCVPNTIGPIGGGAP